MGCAKKKRAHWYRTARTTAEALRTLSIPYSLLPFPTSGSVTPEEENPVLDSYQRAIMIMIMMIMIMIIMRRMRMRPRQWNRNQKSSVVVVAEIKDTHTQSLTHTHTHTQRSLAEKAHDLCIGGRKIMVSYSPFFVAYRQREEARVSCSSYCK